MTITLTTCKTQVIWRSPDVGDKTTSIPGSIEINNGYELDIKTTFGNGDIHTVVPISGTIGGESSFQFIDQNCNLMLVSDAENADWIIRCLCCVEPNIGSVFFNGTQSGWGFF
jgi:hypothetical protein